MKKTPEGLPQMAHFRASVVETPHLALLFKIYEKKEKMFHQPLFVALEEGNVEVRVTNSEGRI